MGVWLDSQKPRLSDRTQLIEVVCDALAASGQDPGQEFVIIHEVSNSLFLMLKYVYEHVAKPSQVNMKDSFQR